MTTLIRPLIKDEDAIKIIEAFGASKQMNHVCQELAELTVQVTKIKDQEALSPIPVISEYVDVMVMMQQFRIMLEKEYPETDIEALIEKTAKEKLKRVFDKIELIKIRGF